MVYALIQPRPQLRSNTFPPPQKFPSKLFTATAKSLQLCLTLCNPIDGSPPGSPVSGILQAITLEWVAISFSNAWKWKVKVKSLSRVRLLVTPWTAAYHGSFQARVLEWDAIAFSTWGKQSEITHHAFTVMFYTMCKSGPSWVDPGIESGSYQARLPLCLQLPL